MTGASIDGSAYRDVVDLAGRAPAWFGTAVEAWTTYGLALFALLMAAAWWRSRRTSPESAVTALAAPLAVLMALGIDFLLKSLVQEDRPCRTLPARTLEACPPPGDWSFPSNHAAIAAASAVALLFVSRRLGLLASVAALAMAASRVWVGVHYPHDVLTGLAVGATVAYATMTVVRRRSRTLAALLTGTRFGPILSVP
ncbi:phosphatase PAP2 family protein [Streptomyces sp. NPDC004539]|uniref:phosphatase PAP2 family protein n=1 Tax=Streptomyces sp. NPDC004539 TaxID=3154280 RepID=UPI0033B51A05